MQKEKGRKCQPPDTAGAGTEPLCSPGQVSTQILELTTRDPSLCISLNPFPCSRQDANDRTPAVKVHGFITQTGQDNPNIT